MPFKTRFAVSFIAVSAVLITILMCLGISFRSYLPTNNEEEYILKSYKNTVALYQNNEIVKVYDEIVLNTLPQIDIVKFNQGITIANPEKIDEFLQDYDG